MKESEISSQVEQALQASGVITHRNNVGCAKFKGVYVRYGVGGNGGSDWIGYLPVRITAAMVGRRLAVFCAVECKRDKGGKITPEQKHFIDNVKAAGGIAGFARSWQDARALIMNFITGG